MLTDWPLADVTESSNVISEHMLQNKLIIISGEFSLKLNAKQPHWGLVNIGSFTGLVLSGNTNACEVFKFQLWNYIFNTCEVFSVAFHELMLTQIYGAIWHR